MSPMLPPPEPFCSMRVQWEVKGGHTHCAIWTGQTQHTHGMAGVLTMTNEEFKAWKEGLMKFEFRKKDDAT